MTSGPAITHAGDLAAILSGMNEGDVLFVDEIHRMARPAEEMLYLAMEDFRVDVVIGKGPGATAIPIEIPRFTLVGATTRAGLPPGRLGDRFGFTAHLEFYEPTSWTGSSTVRPACSMSRRPDAAAAEIASRSRGTPRIANRLLRRVRDFAQVRADGVVTRPVARAALELYEVDALGLDRLDRAVLDALCRRFGGGPVGLSTLAISVAEEARPSRRWPSPSWSATASSRYPAWPGRHGGGVGTPRHDPAPGSVGRRLRRHAVRGSDLLRAPPPPAIRRQHNTLTVRLPCRPAPVSVGQRPIPPFCAPPLSRGCFVLELSICRLSSASRCSSGSSSSGRPSRRQKEHRRKCSPRLRP